MRKYVKSAIRSNKRIAENIYQMVVSFPESLSGMRPGQFVNLYTGKGEMLLPRPISICDGSAENGELRLVYQIVGKGTEHFATLAEGDEINILGPIGNGFNTMYGKEKIAVVGGGVGVPPLVMLVRELKSKKPDAEITVFLGFKSEPILVREFEEMGAKVNVSTDDGSHGFKGTVIDCMKSMDYVCDAVYSCGPKIMLKFLAQWADERDIPCLVSMEERMGCGLGVCVGCVIKVKSKTGTLYHKKVCKDGPVFNAKEVVWE